MAQNSNIKIAVLGAESTGKTWLCESLAKYYKTVWVLEYAREYFNHSNIYNYTLHDLELIAKKQIELEKEMLARAQRFLFCDTTLITLKIWAELEFGDTPALIKEELDNSYYDCYLITNNDIPWQKDEQRQNKFSREKLLEMNISEVKKTGTPYFLIGGAEKERLNNAIGIIDHEFNL